MNVFKFRDSLIRAYEDFARRFTRMGFEDVGGFVAKEYASGCEWPAPLIQINPAFDPAHTLHSELDVE